MKQKLFFILTALFTASTAWAAVGDTFTANNLKYKVTSEAPKTVELTGYSTKPTGAFEIPATANGYAVTSIGKNAFRLCSALTSVVIPEGVTTIGEGAFGYCDAMTSVTIPQGVTTIGKNAFYDCEALKEVVIPSSVTTIGNGAFSYNLSLESVTIPEGVTTIGNEVFSYCIALTEVSIPASVTSIGSKAFESCSALTTINIYAKSLTTYGTDAFKNASSDIEINVFSGSEAAFKKGWADYSGNITNLTAEDLTVSGISVNQNPGATTDYWATYYHPAANTKINTAGVEIYKATLSSDNAYVNLTKVEGSIVKAGQAVMLKAAAAGTLSMELTPDAATGDYTGNDLKGGATVAPGKTAYTLAAKGDKMGFYKFAGTALNPNKAHLELPAGASAREFIAFEDETATGIGNLNLDLNDNDNVNGNLDGNLKAEGWYTLSGHKLQTAPTRKGIYIHNGRKEAVR